MNDLNEFINFFEKFGINYNRLSKNEIGIQDGNKNDRWNYTPCFHCTFWFDDDGKYVDVDYGD